MADANQTTPPAPSSSLLDQVRQNLAKMSQPAAAPGSVLGETAAIQKISSAASGKQVPVGGAGAEPGRSRQGELAVVDQVKRGQEELARNAAMQDLSFGMQQKAIQDTQEFKNRVLSEEQLATREKFLDTQRNILNEYSTGQRKLDLDKDKSKLEQLGFSMRLTNSKYMDELEKQAGIAQLSDALSFEEELTRAIFADEESLLRNDLDFRALISADARAFADELSQIDTELALSIAEADNRAAMERSGWEGLSGMIQAGAKAYSIFPESQNTSYTGAGSSQSILDTEQEYGVNPMGIGTSS